MHRQAGYRSLREAKGKGRVLARPGWEGDMDPLGATRFTLFRLEGRAGREISDSKD